MIKIMNFWRGLVEPYHDFIGGVYPLFNLKGLEAHPYRTVAARDRFNL